MRALEVDQFHIPTDKEKDLPKMSVDNFVLSGDKVFHTIQGEGEFVGRPATFIRLHYCNLACKFCDTWYTWKRDTKEFYQEPTSVDVGSLKSLIEYAQGAKHSKDPCYRLVFTGGEPLLQKEAIINFLNKYPEYTCEIETNGTINPGVYLFNRSKHNNRVHFNVSPKLFNSGQKSDYDKCAKTIEILANARSTFKFVVSSVEDIHEVESFVEKHNIPKSKVFLLPEGTNSNQCARSMKCIASTALSYGYSITPRFHHDLFGGSKRAV
jgi:7-carboxy-7-deazaguanine synthase